MARPAYRAEDDPVTADTKAKVLVRCRGLCEACGGPLGAGPVHFHHRWRRSHGDHSPGNIVALHPPCHVRAPGAVHVRDAERWAKSRGLILVRLPKGRRPADARLIMPSGAVVRLHADRPEYVPVGASGAPYSAISA